MPIELLLELFRFFSLSLEAATENKEINEIMKKLCNYREMMYVQQVEVFFSFMILMKKKKFDDPNMTVF